MRAQTTKLVASTCSQLVNVHNAICLGFITTCAMASHLPISTMSSDVPALLGTMQGLSDVMSKLLSSLEKQRERIVRQKIDFTGCATCTHSTNNVQPNDCCRPLGQRGTCLVGECRATHTHRLCFLGYVSCQTQNLPRKPTMGGARLCCTGPFWGPKTCSYLLVLEVMSPPVVTVQL